MPKVAIDYSKTVVYHFVCKDQMINCQYVGSTTNFNHRKGQHKTACNLETSKYYHFKVYQTIRANGGWDNWSMIPLEEYPCENKMQQLIREQYWMDQLKPEMNVRGAVHDPKAWYEANREELLEKQKVYREANAEYFSKKNKAYHEEHKEEQIEYLKAYRVINKQVLSEKKKTKITCACGAVITMQCKASHERTLKHQKPTV